MKYTMVKQFSNAAIDNVFNFVFKIWDFLKVMYEALWAFLEIWIAFFLIFYNMLMYVYYLFLFVIDRGSESGESVFYTRRRISSKKTYIPSVEISNAPNPIPAMYGKFEDSASKAASAVSSAAGSAASNIPRGTSGFKKSFFKSFFESLIDVLVNIKNVLKKPFILIAEFFSQRLKPVREEEKEESKTKSLIDEYMKEYEQKKK